MNVDIGTLIRTHKGEFTKKESDLAFFVLEYPEQVIQMTITEVADKLNVGQGTIVRFCQKLGFPGFHAFKIALAQSLGKQKELFEDTLDILGLIKSKQFEAIEETYKLLKSNESTIYMSAEKISKCRKLYLVGFGASGATALDSYYKFMRIGLDCVYLPDPHLQMMALSQSTKKDCVLAFSQSGSTALVVDMASIAKKNGSCVISITGYNRSPLTEVSDYVIINALRENPFQSGTIRSKIAQLYVLEVLFEIVRNMLKEKADKNIDKTARSVEKWIY